MLISDMKNILKGKKTNWKVEGGHPSNTQIPPFYEHINTSFIHMDNGHVLLIN